MVMVRRFAGLDREIERAKREAGPLVKERTDLFLEKRRQGWQEWFSEMCFCILTANSTADNGVRIQHEVGFRGFYNLSLESLERELRERGHRFPAARARYIVEARKIARVVRKKVPELVDKYGIEEARDWIIKSVKGLGMKESSHFLRNVGFFGVAIVDRHILRVLERHNLYHSRGPLTRKRYLEAEKIVRKIGERHGLEPGVLDLYLWYLATGRVVK